MTLDEAIKHADEVAEEQEKSAEMWSCYPESKYDNHLARKAYNTCKQCAEEHKQLGEWLKDYKRLLEEQNTWVLCRDKMPEEREWVGTKHFGTTISNEVYVTFETPKGERFTKHLSFQNGKLSKYDQSQIDAFYKGSVPIAWMSLPKPYQAESEG